MRIVIAVMAIKFSAPTAHGRPNGANGVLAGNHAVCKDPLLATPNRDQLPTTTAIDFSSYCTCTRIEVAVTVIKISAPMAKGRPNDDKLSPEAGPLHSGHDHTPTQRL